MNLNNPAFVAMLNRGANSDAGNDCAAELLFDEPNAVVNQQSGGTLSGYPITSIVNNNGTNNADPHEPILNSSYDSGLVYADHAAALTALNAGTYTSTATSTLFMRVVRADDVALTNPFPYLLDGFFPLDNQGNDTSPEIPFHDGQPHGLLTSISGQLCKLEIYGSLEKNGCTNSFQWFSPTFEWYYYTNCTAPTLTAPNLRIDWAGSASAGWTPSLISETASVTLNADIHIRLTQGSYNLLYGNAAASDEAIISIGDIQNGYDLSTLDSSLSNLANCQQNINLTARIVPVIDCNHGTPNWPISKVWDFAEEESATATAANCVGTNIDATDCTSGATVTLNDPNSYGANVGDVVSWYDGNAATYACGTVTSTTSTASVSFGIDSSGFADCADCNSSNGLGGGGGGGTNFEVTDCNDGSIWVLNDAYGYSPSIGDVVDWYDPSTGYPHCGTITANTADPESTYISYTHSDCTDCNDYNMIP